MNFLIHSYEDNDTDDEFDLRDSAFLYWAWAASVVGPVVYILAVVHAVLWGLPSAIAGSLVYTCICSYMQIICVDDYNYVYCRQPFLVLYTFLALNMDLF